MLRLTSKGECIRNGLEKLLESLEAWSKGTDVAVEPFHLEHYIDEQAFRYNNRATKDNPLNDADRFLLALSHFAKY